MVHSPSPDPNLRPTHPHDDATQAIPQDDMTQASFDRLTSVVSANECTGLIPSGQIEDDARMFGELGGSTLPGESVQPQ